MGTSQITDLLYVITNGGAKSQASYAAHTMQALKRMLHIHASDEEDWDRVACSTFDDLEDAFIFQTAIRVKADAIISRDKKGFAKSSIKVMSCDELFQHLIDQGFDYADIIFDLTGALDSIESSS